MNSKQIPSPHEYAMILENIEDAVIALDQRGHIKLINPAAQDYAGLSEKQCLGNLFFERFSHQETLCYLVRSALREGRSISDHETIVLRMPGTRQRPISVTVSPIFNTAGEQRGVVLIMRDLTQVRTLEEAIRRAERLSMIGTMAAGLAHEIKNPLGGIKGAAQLLQMELESNQELQEYTQLMIRETERVNRIIEELMDLSRPREAQHNKVNISQVLDEIVMLQKQSVANRGICFKLRLDPSIPPLSGDRDLLVRMLLNLVKNAAEAEPDEGEVVIESRIDSEYHLNIPGTRPTPMVQIIISDNGPGIPKPQLDKIFTPFYTTKDGGTGLGLPICQKIISDHGGLLNFLNRPEGGTSVKISLPLLRNPGIKPSSEEE